ncbi:GNAT family N-acetyltransferase [Marinicella rhabdoformis]|uniref:GNAT family N-acetyltransferase n=1 Tax=Marinicella rhabdoformis TaxID=2580566 RepID=UPI0012AEC9CD|nr:GNAT family N-acetyltransferase [Marinicella rhabdoformis]
MYKKIKHHEESQRFELVVDGHTAYLSYALSRGVADYNHTIVPSDLGGRGIGTELVKYALAYARVNHWSVIPSCSFVAHYIQKNSGEQDLLA